MLPHWFIKELEEAERKRQYEPQQLELELPMPHINDIKEEKDEKKEERGVVIIDL